MNALEASVAFNTHLYDCHVWQPHTNNAVYVLLLVFAHLIYKYRNQPDLAVLFLIRKQTKNVTPLILVTDHPEEVSSFSAVCKHIFQLLQCRKHQS